MAAGGGADPPRFVPAARGYCAVSQVNHSESLKHGAPFMLRFFSKWIPEAYCIGGDCCLCSSGGEGNSHSIIQSLGNKVIDYIVCRTVSSCYSQRCAFQGCSRLPSGSRIVSQLLPADLQEKMFAWSTRWYCWPGNTLWLWGGYVDGVWTKPSLAAQSAREVWESCGLCCGAGSLHFFPSTCAYAVSHSSTQ